MDMQDRIIQLIKLKGPVIPAQIAKDIDQDLILTSAYLSELVSKKKLKISALKFGGGSPLYFIPTQEHRLQDFSNNLNEKNKRTFEFLKENKVLRDSELSPLMRVSIREIKDFAKPLEVTFNDNKEIFWKWYTLDNKEAEQEIKQKLSIPLSTTETMEQKEVTKEREAEKTETKEKKETKTKDIPATERQEKLPVKEEAVVKEEAAPVAQQDESNLTRWQNKDSKFIRKLKNYFILKKIELIGANINRKDSDLEFTIIIDSSIGKITYFCRAKSKKKINEGDLSSVFMQGQMKKLPVLMLITGDMTKKANEMLATELKGLSVVRIE